MDWKWLSEVLFVPIAFGIAAGVLFGLFLQEDTALGGAIVGALLTRVKLSKPANGSQ